MASGWESRMALKFLNSILDMKSRGEAYHKLPFSNAALEASLAKNSMMFDSYYSPKSFIYYLPRESRLRMLALKRLSTIRENMKKGT